jgi:hypothetical protein
MLIGNIQLSFCESHYLFLCFQLVFSFFEIQYYQAAAGRHVVLLTNTYYMKFCSFTSIFPFMWKWRTPRLSCFDDPVIIYVGFAGLGHRC